MFQIRMDNSFQPILDVSKRMQGFPADWFVSGGWAIDLFLGRVTRSHSDIEIGIYRCHEHLLFKQLPDWEFEKAIPSEKSGTWERWFCEENLQLPIHQIKAIHPHTDEFEFFLNERDHSHWASRRHEGLTRPVEEVLGRSDTGIPFLAPEIQLLFKAKYTRPKDQSDFDLSLPQLRAA